MCAREEGLRQAIGHLLVVDQHAHMATREQRVLPADTSCGEGSVPFMMASRSASGRGDRAAGGGEHVVGDRLGARDHGARMVGAEGGQRRRARVPARPRTGRRWRGRSRHARGRSCRECRAAMASATRGMVAGSYQRCGLRVVSGRPSRCCTSITCRPGRAGRGQDPVGPGCRSRARSPPRARRRRALAATLGTGLEAVRVGVGVALDRARGDVGARPPGGSRRRMVLDADGRGGVRRHRKQQGQSEQGGARLDHARNRIT